MKWILIVVIYFVGAFMTKILITIYDHYAPLHYRFDDADIIGMYLWFLVVPLMILVLLYKKCEDIGDWIYKILKQ